MQESLKEFGWGSNTEFVVRQADGTVQQMQDFANELVRENLEIVVTASTPAAAALKQATSSIPIVFVNIFDPVAAGLVASLERPGGNLTGIAGFRADIAAQWVTTLKEVAPQVTRMALFFNPDTAAAMAPVHMRAGVPAAASLGVELTEARVPHVSDIEQTVSSLAKEPNQGLIVIPHTFAFAHRRAIIDAVALLSLRVALRARSPALPNARCARSIPAPSHRGL